MKNTSKNNADSQRMPLGESNHGLAEIPRDLRCPDGKPLQMYGLAVVLFETVSEFHPSIDEEVDIISEFSDLRFIEGLPDPDVLQKWLIADKVLVNMGDPVGLVPMRRYMEAGLFSCSPSIMVSNLGASAPQVRLGILPRGIMWLKKNYVPTPERHRGNHVPVELQDSLESYIAPTGE